MQNVLFENHIFRSLEPNSFVLHCVLHTALNDKAVKSLNSKTVERSPVKALQKVNECQKSNCICTYICICICIVFVIEITQFKDCWEWSTVIALQKGEDVKSQIALVALWQVLLWTALHWIVSQFLLHQLVQMEFCRIVVMASHSWT